jgi:hypothetical protein
MSEETIKATFMLTPTAKYRLSSLKARLKREGYTETTESSLVEHLLTPTYIQTLEADIRSSTGQRKPK